MLSDHSTILHPRTRDLTGMSFGRLTVIAFAGYRQDGHASPAWWQCECSCGVRKDVSAGYLINGGAQSCGCLRIEQLTHHGHTVDGRITLEYSSWSSMKTRCENQNGDAYARYGGRGITICEAWRTSFATFLADMGPRPSRQHTLERRDNNQGYSKENCLWATKKDQARNTRNNTLLTFQEKTQCLEAWAEELGMLRNTIMNRINLYNWSIERALTTPVRPKRPNGTGRTPTPLQPTDTQRSRMI